MSFFVDLIIKRHKKHARVTTHSKLIHKRRPHATWHSSSSSQAAALPREPLRRLFLLAEVTSRFARTSQQRTEEEEEEED